MSDAPVEKEARIAAAAARALAEAGDRRAAAAPLALPPERGGPAGVKAGAEPVRYGDWERRGNRGRLLTVAAVRNASMKRQVICIHWGRKFGPAYINRLYAMVARNLTPPFTFTCFTDSSDGVRPEVRCEPLPPLDAVMPTGTKGIWPKARLWGPQLGGLEGPVLFLDLDLVVVGSLDPFFEQGEPGDVILARNQSTPFEKLGQTSCFRFPVGKLVPLQENFIADPQGVADRYRFEQRFVTREAPGGIGFWPKPWVRHFRIDCARALPLNFFLPPKLPGGARVVIFPGGLLPPHAVAGHWGRHYKPLPPGEHVKAAFARGPKPDPTLSFLRHYMIAPNWVAEAWRED